MVSSFVGDNVLQGSVASKYIINFDEVGGREIV